MAIELPPNKEFFELMEAERNNQLNKWGLQFHNYNYWLAILAEEFGEFAKLVCEGGDRQKIVKELTQIATVCMAIQQEGHF